MGIIDPIRSLLSAGQEYQRVRDLFLTIAAETYQRVALTVGQVQLALNVYDAEELLLASQIAQQLNFENLERDLAILDNFTQQAMGHERVILSENYKLWSVMFTEWRQGLEGQSQRQDRLDGLAREIRSLIDDALRTAVLHMQVLHSFSGRIDLPAPLGRRG